MNSLLIAQSVDYYTPMCIVYVNRGNAVEAGWYAKMSAGYVFRSCPELKDYTEPTIYGGNVDHSQVETVKAGKL